VGFLANRNVLVAATFGFSALVAHDAWRRGGSRLGAALAPALLLGALFSKEEGSGTCAYLGAYALCFDPRGWRRGCLALAPAVACSVVWALLRASWGYGVRDVGLYIDPVTDTGRWLSAAVGRVPLLLMGLWSPVPSDAGILSPEPGFSPLLGFALAWLGAVFAAIVPLLRRDRLARFWALGMLLATLPVSATIPGDRLLTFAGLGASGLLARFLEFAFAGSLPSRPSRWLVRAVAAVLIVVHGVIAPLILPLRAGNPLGPAWVERAFYIHTPLGRSLEGKTVVVVNAPSAMHADYLVLLRELRGEPGPERIRVLGPAIPGVTIRREDGRTLSIRPEQGFLRMPLDAVFRSERKPLREGETVRLTGMTATVAALTPDGRPSEVTFRFDEPLESPDFVWLCYRGDRFVPFSPPPVGREVEIPFDWKAVFSRP
jgi:hypothetical protein